MKLCTRKFLAGLLSFGMLLQAASPLSALAAATTVKAELTINISNADDQDGVTYEISPDSATVGDLATVSYADGTYTIKGMLGQTLGDVVVISGANGSTPSVVVENTSTAICGDLIAKNLNNVTIHSVIHNGVHGYATVDCTGDVLFQANGNPIMNDLTVTSAHDVTVIGEGNANTVGKADITCTGDVLIKNTSTKNNGGIAVGRGLTVHSAENVTISSSNSSTSVDWNATIREAAKIDCTGDVLIENTGDGHAVTGNLTVKTPGDVTVSTSTDATPLYTVGKGTIAHARITANALTISNASTDSEAVLIPLKFAGYNGNEGYTAYTKADKSETINVPTDDVTSIKGNYLRIESGTKTQPTKHTLTLTNAKAYTDKSGTTELDGGTTAEAGVTTYNVEAGKKVYVKAVAPSEGQWKFYNFQYSTTIRDRTVEDGIFIFDMPDDEAAVSAIWVESDEEVKYGITVTMDNGTPIEVTSKNCENILGTEYTDGKLVYDPKANTLTGTGSFSALEINANGADVVLSNGDSASSSVVNGTLTINNANNITVTAAEGTAAVNGKLTVDGANDVTVTGKRDNHSDSNSYGTIIDGDVDITCTNDVLFENKGTGDVVGGDNTVTFGIHAAHDVTLIGNSTGSAYPIWGSADITCSGIVTLECKTSIRVVDGAFSYNQSNSKAYEVKAGDDADSAKVIYTGEAGEAYGLTSTETENYSYLCITPAGNGDNTTDDTTDTTVTTDPGSTAGGAVAAVVVGGAAILGGYEIATRVILHNILPEGAAIPANRGQLALLIWNNAGKPEPVNTPAFTDVSDADMAKAAQWCVEQGIMEAKTEDTFKPDGWTPKFKVIETWNRAFPKQ